MAKDNTNWVPFWFESNAAWGMATNQESWAEIRKNYAKSHPNDDPSLIYTATSTKNSGRNGCNYNFGFRLEHIGGEKTLKAFFEQNGMPL